jgi:flavin-dependent dehydrogenase
MIEADVLVVGAGPAGTGFALNLAHKRRVVVVDRLEPATVRIGESLAPAARRLLTDMGLWESFLAEGHRQSFGGRSVWGGPEPVERDNLRDLDGSGWHMDRAKFDSWLRRVAMERGAALLVPARPREITRSGDVWHFELVVEGQPVPARARLLVDAGGRGSAIARGFGATRVAGDRLVCGWMHGVDRPGPQAGLTHIEAEPDGWWYTAPLPDSRRVVAFHTDADLPAADSAAGHETLLKRLSSLAFLSGVLAKSEFKPNGAGGYTAAHSAVLQPPVGDGWMAVGDAALAFDPLSSQGMLNALYTGLVAAEAADRLLSGDTAALLGYQTAVASVHAAYRSQLHQWYGLERRWADRPFWQRRHGSLP